MNAHEIRAERLAKNQSLFRDLNSRVEELNRAFSFVSALNDFICECANDACTTHIALSVHEYGEIHANAIRFSVAAADGHFYPDIEDLVEQNERYWVVEKVGRGAEVATAAAEVTRAQ